MSKRNFPLGYTNYSGSSSSPNYHINGGLPKQVNSSKQQQQTKKMQKIFQNNFKFIAKRLEDFLIAYLITKDIYADSEDIEDDLEISDIGQIYNVFESNFKNKSTIYKNFFQRENGQVIQVKTLLNREILPTVDVLKNENDDILYELFSNVLGDFYNYYGTLPNYKREIVTIGRSIIEEIEKKLKNILLKQQRQQQQKQRQQQRQQQRQAKP